MKYVLSLLLFLSTFASASDTPFTKLKKTTAHISIGTGFIFQGESKTTYLITNWHVCNRGQWRNTMTGSLTDGEVVRGPIVRKNPLSDLCAVKIPPRKAVLKLAKTLKAGQKLYTRGYPFGVLSQSAGHFVGVGEWAYIYAIQDVGECFEGSLKVLDGRGVVAGCQTIYRDNRTNFYSRPGSSGSPVVDENGDLVGVMSSWDGGDDTGGMVRFEDLQDFVKGL